jgi:hypothetical protein
MKRVRQLIGVLLVLVMLSSVVSPALAIDTNESKNSICKICKLNNPLSKNTKLLVSQENLKIYKAEYKGKIYLLKIIEEKTNNGRIVGKVQIAILPQDRQKITNIKSIQGLQKLSWQDIIKKYEMFVDTLDECGDSGKHHHYVGVTFELGEAGGVIEDTVLSWAICTLIGFLASKHPVVSVIVGLGCSIAVALWIHYHPTEKKFTIGAWDYDWWIFHMSADGIGVGWHTPVSKMIPLQTYPYHRLTW